MKILWVKGGKLLPVNTGGRIRSYNILRQLGRRHEVVLLTYYVGQADREYEEEIARQFPGAVTARSAARDETLVGRAFHYLRKLPLAAPFAISKFVGREARRKLEESLCHGGFDVAVCDFLAAALAFPRRFATPTVLFQHNVEGELWRRRARFEPNPVTRLAYTLEAAKMIRFERAMVARFHHTIAVSQHDADLMKSMVDPSRITVVPTGVDLEQFRDAAHHQAALPLVIFTGSMDWEPNIDGIEYFCAEIWPRVLEKAPAARFRIVGRDPHPRVRRLASESVEVTGTVPSVIDHISEAAIFVVPLRVGGGTRLKIFEAMAMAKPVVSTTVGAEGLDVHNGRDIFLADDAPSFAGCIVKLLEDSRLREGVGKAAAELAAQCDWSVIARRFEEVLAHTIDSSRRAQPAP